MPDSVCSVACEPFGDALEQRVSSKQNDNNDDKEREKEKERKREKRKGKRKKDKRKSWPESKTNHQKMPKRSQGRSLRAEQSKTVGAERRACDSRGGWWSDGDTAK